MMITAARARELRQLIMKAAESLTDEDALNGVELFPAWQTATSYAVGDRCAYQETLYKCVQAHTSQDDWTPDVTPALWVMVSLDEWPEWVQPTGAQDAYQLGDQVSHNEKHWLSIVDDNVWEPGVYGWEEQA